MSLNFLLGAFSMLVACITLGYRFLLPAPQATVVNPYAGTFARSWFSVLSLGIVPLVASMFFFAAWWYEGPAPPQHEFRPRPASQVQATMPQYPADHPRRERPATSAKAPSTSSAPTPVVDAPEQR